ncbi:hypothetical protein SAMD00019534_086330, partial [Acytostelium subglobosum LB1]|uniref:hypothetical protein n=1 Tax=Acytostelium subglobosum LB1 TaxID=1410327 RepID=UPI0006449835
YTYIYSNMEHQSASIRRLAVTGNHLAANETSAPAPAPTASPTLEIARTFDPKALHDYLFPYHKQMRQDLYQDWLGADFLTTAPFGLSHMEERDLTIRQFFELNKLSKKYGITVMDFINDPTKLATWIQCYRLRNPSVSTLFGVHYALFGASIVYLGSDEQRERYIKHVEDLTMLGCFGLTELGHGSNVQRIETQAYYDHATSQFVLHSPTITSQKYFIGGAGQHAKWAVIFAQLRVGEKYEGVHAFICRIRNEDGTVCPGVKLADCGHKMALNGVDNGRIMFVNYCVPRDQLLCRHGGVNKAGVYESPINPAGKRFAHNIGALVIGRYFIALACVSFSIVSLLGALRYSFTRRQFGEDHCERQIISYSVHQRRLIPHLAFTYAVHFGNEHLLRLLAVKDTAQRKDKEIHIYASGLKAYGSWQNRDTLQSCREACGGQGFLSINMIGQFKSETEIYTTFEGDNVLMYQQVTKFILSENRKHPVPEYVVPSDAARQNVDPAYLRSVEFLTGALRSRLHHQTPFVTNKLIESVGMGKPVLDAWNDNGSYILNLGVFYTENFMLERFIDAVAKCPDAQQRNALSSLLSLMGLCIIERDSWFVKHQYISVEQSDAISNEIDLLCKEITPHAVSLCEGFGFDQNCLGPIGNDWIRHNEY